MKKRFGIDIDGTVTRADSLLPYINRQFQLNLGLNDITEYDLTVATKTTQEEFGSWFYGVEAEIYENSALNDFAKETLTSWSSDHDLIYISARRSNLLTETTNWFHRHELPFHLVDLIGSHYKIEAAKKHQVDIFFEDKHDNAVMLHEQLNIPVILFDTPYNRLPIPEGVIRVSNWKEAQHWVNNWIHLQKETQR